MQLLLAILAVLVSGILVVLVPGSCMVAIWRLDRIVPPPLIPATALALGLVPLTAAMSAALLLHLPIAWVAGALALFVALGWARVVGREARERRRASTVRSGPRAGAREWIAPLRSLVGGEWLRATPRSVLLVAAAGGVLALYVGFYAWNDSLYHIGQAQKLLALDHPTFSNTLQFPDGSAHPGYLLPAWQEVIALVSFVSQQDPVTAAWILPALTFPVSVLAFGGLGWTVFRSPAAAPVTAAALLLAAVATLPYSDAITNAMQPGVLALGVLAPLAVAMLLTALWQPPRDRDVDAASPRTTTRAATLVAMVATAGVGMLNVGYLWVLGMGIAAYYVVWALRGPWPRDVVRRHLITGLSIAAVAGVVLALLYPGLSNLEGLGRSAEAELTATDNTQYQGENGADLDQLLRGDPAGAFHLRGDYLIQSGGLGLLGLIGLLVPVLMPRWPGGWYLSGAGLFVLGISLSDTIFPKFVNVVTLDQARRIERVLPLELGLAALVLALVVGARLLWSRGGALRAAAAGLLAAGTAAIAVVTNEIPRLAGYAGARIVHPRVLLMVLLALALYVVVLGAGLVVRLARRGRTAPSQAAWPTSLLDPPIATAALIVLLVGSIPVLGELGSVARSERLDQVPIEMRGAELRLFSDNVAAALRRLPVGSTVLADPRSRNPYTAMAIAPVYVVSSVPRHTALTPKNRVTERFDLAVSFFTDDMDVEERTRFLVDNHVDAVLVHPSAAGTMQDQLADLPGVRVVAQGKNQRLYVIDRDALSAATR
ncbi:MAG: hypothetical protein KDC46_09765 [Thermoleophilia bacterium]|nr:hypothetical protein [Thermoleophilia bacterium]